MISARAVGALSPFVGGTYYGSLLAGAAAAAGQQGRGLIAIQTLDAAADLAIIGGNPDFTAAVAWDHVSGFVVYADAVKREYLLRLQAAGKPFILVGHTVPGIDRPTVLADNAAGVRAAVTHLIQAHGCRRIAFTGHVAATDIAERHEAYRATLRAHGLEPEEALFLPAANNRASGITWTADDLLRHGRPDAIVAATDRNAIGAQRALAAAGLRCPDDYRLTGFDNIDLAGFLRPELASVGQPLDAMSRLAVELLLRELGGETVRTGTYRIATRFVPRTSCGCAGFAETLPVLDLAGALPRLVHRLETAVTAEAEVTGLAGTAARAASTTAAALLAATRGDTSGASAAADALRVLHDASPSQETLRLISRSVQEYSATLHPADAAGADRLAGCVLDIVMFLGRAHHRTQLGDQIHLRSVISVNYELSMALLHRQDADPRDPSWLARTPATAGSIALRTAGGELGRTPGWRRRPGPPIPAGPTTVETFPPVELVEAADPGETVFVVRAKVGASDRGWLSLVDTVENRVEDGRELVNQGAALLTVALDRRDQQEQLRQAANSDRLTALPNRASFAQSLEEAIQRERPFTVLFLDLDGFKIVNDRLGHHAGDLLLISVGRRIREALRPADVAARFGGDEFVVLLDEVTPGPELTEVVGRLHATITQPHQLTDHQVQVGVSIGWAAGDRNATAQGLLQAADTAMYRVKAAAYAGASPGQNSSSKLTLPVTPTW